MAYTKLFHDIILSTIWQEDNDLRVLWITLLATCDYNGDVMASIPGLAKTANITIDACESGMNKFMSPDRYSRNQDDEGRRIKVIDGGWHLINYEKYRARTDRRNYKREYMRKYRAEKKETPGTSDLPKKPITPLEPRKPLL